MSEISSRVSGPVLEALARRGIASRDLVRGTGIPLEKLQRPGYRISWDEWIALLDRAEALGGPDVLEQIGAGIHEVSWNRILAAIGRIAWTESQFWKLVTQRIAPAMYPQIDFRFEPLDGGRFRVAARIRDGFRSSMPLMRLFSGALRGSTRLLGHDDMAQVEFRLGSRVASAVVTPHASPGRLRALYRRIAGFVLGRSAATELERQHRDLLRSHAQLEESQARLHAITRGGFDMVAELDAERRFVYASPNVRTILGFQPAAVLGSDAMDLLHPEDRELFLAKFEGVLEERSDQATLRFRDRRGEWRWIESTATPFRTPLGELRVSIVARDVSEARLAAEHLQRSQKMEAVGRLAGGIAHDFNNLLTVIQGNGELLQNRLGVDDPDREAAAEILEAADQASLLTRQLLTLGRKQPAEICVLDLGEVARRLVPMVGSLLGEGIRLDLEFATEELPMRADRGQLEQILVNLIVNARDAMPHGGRCHIATRAIAAADGGPCVQLLVGDDGLGMDAETQSRAFEPFFSTKGSEGGSGLGLSTVYAIAEQSGGLIRLTSTPDVGTTVTIDFPRVDDPLPEPRDVVAGPSPGGRETILLVEDQPALRRLAMRILVALGYRVVEAGDAEEAIALVESDRGVQEFDLLATDVVLPGLSGTDLWKRLSERDPRLRVLFFSGYTGAGAARDEVLERESFLAKPFTGSELAEAVRSTLDAARHAPRGSDS